MCLQQTRGSVSGVFRLWVWEWAEGCSCPWAVSPLRQLVASCLRYVP